MNPTSHWSRQEHNTELSRRPNKSGSKMAFASIEEKVLLFWSSDHFSSAAKGK